MVGLRTTEGSRLRNERMSEEAAFAVLACKTFIEGRYIDKRVQRALLDLKRFLVKTVEARQDDDAVQQLSEGQGRP